MVKKVINNLQYEINLSQELIFNKIADNDPKTIQLFYMAQKVVDLNTGNVLKKRRT